MHPVSRILLICLQCKGTFFRLKCQLRRPSDGRFCSRDCKYQYDKPLEQRFWEKVQKEKEGCWIWTGNVTADFGYGIITYKKKGLKAHRVSWEIHRGAIPRGAQINHKCDNPRCVRPDHLYPGTQKQNLDDMFQRGRARRARGEFSGRARLTAVQVQEIRRTNRIIPLKTLAQQYGVSWHTVASVRYGNSWKHLPISAS